VGISTAGFDEASFADIKELVESITVESSSGVTALRILKAAAVVVVAEGDSSV
jgi:predicted NAD/FAD-binding protein